jgi:hypothetical protein
MNAEFTSGDHFAEVNPGDPLYRDLQLRGYNRRFVGTPESMFVVDDTDQVVHAVDAVVASGKQLGVRSGGHCVEGLVDDPAVQCVIDLRQMDSVRYDRHRRAVAVEAGATLGRVYQALDMSRGVTVPGGSCTGVGMGGHVTGGGNFGVATKFWFRSRDGQGDDPTRLLPKRPSGYTTASVAWRWADLDEESFTTLVNNYIARSCGPRWTDHRSRRCSNA